MSAKKIFGINKNIFFLGLTSLFNDFSSEMVFAAFPAFFVSVLKAGASALGLVDGLAESLSNFLKIYSGHLSDRLQRRKRLVISGYTLSVLTRPFYILVTTVGGALGLRVADRVGKGLRDAPRDAIISLSADPSEKGKSFGYHRAMDTTGAILGPLAAYLLLRYFPLRFNLLFLVAFFIGIIALLTLLFITDVSNPTKKRSQNLIRTLRGFSLQYKLMLVAVLVLSCGSLPLAIILLKTQSLGLILAAIPLFYMIYNVAYAIFSIPAGKMSDRSGPRRVIISGYAILLIGYFVINAAHSTSALVIGFLVLGLFPALTDGVERSLASQLTTADSRGSALGLLNAVNGLGVLIAGIGGGYLWQRFSPTVAFMAAGGMVVLGLLVFLLAPYIRPNST